MDFKTYKIACEDIGCLVPSFSSAEIATPLQLEKAILALSAENSLALSDTRIKDILTVIDKKLKYGKDSLPNGAKVFLSGVYAKLVYGIGNIDSLQEYSNRRFQINGIKCE